MAGPTYEEYLKMNLEQVSFAKEELKRREKAPVHVPREKIDRDFHGHNWVLLVDPRLGSGAHRHHYEEINHVLSGEGYSVSEDKRYEWKKGDTLAIPIFSWHQHFNTGKEPARILVHTGRPAMENIGLMITQQGEVAEF